MAPSPSLCRACREPYPDQTSALLCCFHLSPRFMGKGRCRKVSGMQFEEARGWCQWCGSDVTGDAVFCNRACSIAYQEDVETSTRYSGIAAAPSPRY